MTKFNRLNNGVVSRQRKVVSKHREDESLLPPNIITRHSGSGPTVGDVSYEKGQLRVSHNNVYNNPAVDNSRVAIAQQGAISIGDLPDIEQPDAWWPSDSPGDSLILPDDFDPNTDEFPELPVGYFYARLDRGCEPCGLFAWDAGLEDTYWSAQSFVKPSSASLLRVFISDLGSRGSTPATLELWFDQPIQYSTLQVTEFINLLVIRSSFGTPVVPLSITISESKATVGLDRAVDLREEIYVQVRRGLLDNNSTSPFLSASGKGKRYEYVICFNRSHVESDIAEGDGVVLTTPYRIYDKDGNWMWVFDTSPLGGSAPQYIRIDGGQELNATPEVTGIKGAPIPDTVPADLDPGEVDSAGVETVAPTGTFPDGIGYGTLYGSDGTVIGRRLVRLEGTTALAGWTFYAGGSVQIPIEGQPEPEEGEPDERDKITFLVVNNA